MLFAYALMLLVWLVGWLVGFTQSRESDNSISKCAWLILAIFGYGITFFQCYKTINTFFAFETNTQITFNTGAAFHTDIPFPSVTVCNSNRIHCERLYNAITNCTKVISWDYFIQFMWPIAYMKNNIVGNTILFFPWTSITIVHSSFTVWCVCWQKKLLFQSVFDCHFSKQNTNNCFFISFPKREKYNL